MAWYRVPNLIPNNRKGCGKVNTLAIDKWPHKKYTQHKAKYFFLLESGRERTQRTWIIYLRIFGSVLYCHVPSLTNKNIDKTGSLAQWYLIQKLINHLRLMFGVIFIDTQSLSKFVTHYKRSNIFIKSHILQVRVTTLCYGLSQTR